MQAQYATRHASHPDPTVRWIDLAFAFHALLLSLVTLSQFKPHLWGWNDRQEATSLEFNNERPTRTVCWLLAGAGLVVIISIAAVIFGDSNGEGRPRWQWLDVVRVMFLLLTPSYFLAPDQSMQYVMRMPYIELEER